MVEEGVKKGEKGQTRNKVRKISGKLATPKPEKTSHYLDLKVQEEILTKKKRKK